MKSKQIIRDNNYEQASLNLKQFFGQATIEKIGELYEQIQWPAIDGNKLGVSPRNLNYWYKSFGNVKEKWGEKYSFVDYVWYNMIEQLREVGIKIEVLKELRNNLFKPIEISTLANQIQEAKELLQDLKIDKEKKEKLLQLIGKKTVQSGHFNMLQLVIVDCMVNRLPLSLAIYADGSYMVLDRSKEHLYSETEQNKLLFETHTTVSIFSIINRFFNSELSGQLVPMLGLLSPAENKLFEAIHSGDYQSITIHFKDKKIKSLELKKNENPKDRLADIINRGEFGEIVIKKHKGQITKIENTIKITL